MKDRSSGIVEQRCGSVIEFACASVAKCGPPKNQESDFKKSSLIDNSLRQEMGDISDNWRSRCYSRP